MNSKEAKMTMRNVINHPPAHHLSDILSLLSQSQLVKIAANLELRGRTKLRHEELVKQLPEYIMDFITLDSKLLLTNDEEFSLFERALKEPTVQDNDIDPENYMFLMMHGYIFAFLDMDQLQLVVPDEVKEMSKQLNWDDVREARIWYQEILAYAKAAVNLYGLCTIDKIEEIYNSHNDPYLSAFHLRDIIDCFMERGQPFHWIGPHLASDYFDLDNLHEYTDLLSKQNLKPHYIPNKTEFLKYADDSYYEHTPQLRRLRLFILNQLCSDAEWVDGIIDEIHLLCVMEEPMQAIIDTLDERDIVFDNENQIKMFVDLVFEVMNHSRLWSNCGYTPAELSKLRIQSSNVVEQGQSAKSIKVGRNEPCPCGSGLKYKKCCGK